jgi:hypothetical protein
MSRTMYERTPIHRKAAANSLPLIQQSSIRSHHSETVMSSVELTRLDSLFGQNRPALQIKCSYKEGCHLRASDGICRAV